jgi:hypothetical protein
MTSGSFAAMQLSLPDVDLERSLAFQSGFSTVVHAA